LKALVLDASAALGWMVDRPTPPQAARARHLILSGATPVVPALWLQEVLNAIMMAERRGRLTPDQVGTLAGELEIFLTTAEVDMFLVPPGTMIDLARRAHLTVYGATYLELASRRRLPLATLDDKLRKAARRAGHAVI